MPLPAAIVIPASVLWALVGLCMGSFLSVVVSRLPAGEGIGGRSRCPACSTTLGPLELIPVVSFFLLQRKCRRCGKKISWRYPLLEILCAALFLLALWTQDFAPLPTLVLSLALGTLFACAAIDAESMLIPDVLSIGFIFLAFVFAALTHLSFPAALIGAAFFGVQWAVSRGKWVGSADILLGFGIGLLLGDWRRMLVCLFTSYIVGAAVALVLIAQSRVTRNSAVAFGPFLLIGALAGLLIPERVLDIFLPF